MWIRSHDGGIAVNLDNVSGLTAEDDGWVSYIDARGAYHSIDGYDSYERAVGVIAEILHNKLNDCRATFVLPEA